MNLARFRCVSSLVSQTLDPLSLSSAYSFINQSSESIQLLTQLHGGQIVPFKEAFFFDKEEKRRIAML